MSELHLTITDTNFPASIVTHRGITEKEAQAILAMLDLGAAGAVWQVLRDATLLGTGAISCTNRVYHAIRPETILVKADTA